MFGTSWTAQKVADLGSVKVEVFFEKSREAKQEAYLIETMSTTALLAPLTKDEKVQCPLGEVVRRHGSAMTASIAQKLNVLLESRQ